MAGWFPHPKDYRSTDLISDLSAGLTLGILLIPQAMAYGMLAGVDPVYGLYAALVPVLLYTLMATTPHVSVGPTALASLLCLNGLSGLAEPGTPEYLAYAVLLGGLIGVLHLLFGLLRLGGVVSLLSRPVLSGFVSAAAVLIMVSQLDVLLGISVDSGIKFHASVWQLLSGAPGLHLPTALLGTGAFLSLLAAQRWLPLRFPTMLVLIALSTALVSLFGKEWGVATVEDIPAGLPVFSLPAFELTSLQQLLPVALVMALISFIETLSIGKAFAPNYPFYRISPDRESIALGVGKIAGAFFQAIPSSASFSRSAVLEQGGGNSPLGSLTALLLLVLVLVFFTPLFYYLPIPVLAAIIIYSVRNLLDLREMSRLWKFEPKEFATLMITFLFTLFAGLQYGIAGGVLLSLVFVFWRAARPHLAELGRVPGTNAFRNRSRFEEAEVDPAILLVRFDAELYFGNAEYFQERMEKLVRERGKALHAVIIDGHTINDIDTSGLFVLTRFLEALEKQGVGLYLCGMIGPVRDKLYRSGLMERMGAERNFLSIQSALDYLDSHPDDRWGDAPAVQHG
ncbi:MAG: SulP family sulfate permease [Neolewinella sp.]|jgi:SulP family sulfate permease